MITGIIYKYISPSNKVYIGQTINEYERKHAFLTREKYAGEKFSMAKAKEVCERYRGVIPQSFTHADVYVAINEHYHNCSELFKSWFGEDIDQKVIEAAILFWFKDDDCKSNSKLWNHFKEN